MKCDRRNRGTTTVLVTGGGQQPMGVKRAGQSREEQEREPQRPRARGAFGGGAKCHTLPSSLTQAGSSSLRASTFPVLLSLAGVCERVQQRVMKCRPAWTGQKGPLEARCRKRSVPSNAEAQRVSEVGARECGICVRA